VLTVVTTSSCHDTLTPSCFATYAPATAMASVETKGFFFCEVVACVLEAEGRIDRFIDAVVVNYDSTQVNSKDLTLEN
jgi:hypothetical protein